MPHTLSTAPCNLYPPSERHYNSSLSIWLSVDPMSDKYPGVSPYTYCANNPVKLVDPNGEQWETPDDKEIADNLVRQANTNIDKNNNSIGRLSSNKFKAFIFKGAIKNLQQENSYLKEGIENINNMTDDVSTMYHFEYISKGDGGVFRTSSGTQNIQYRNYAMAWHETVHIGDARANPSLWGFNRNSYLGTTEDNFYKSEVKAYSSQFSFAHSSMNSFNNSKINNLNGVREWININTDHRPKVRY